MKDNFSSLSDGYAKYRPQYPKELFDYLNSIVPHKNQAWDCGTGNGQIAFELAKTFKNVFATDISQNQINNAKQSENIVYSVQAAEKTNFQNSILDLIVVAQAIHWFDFNQFYYEVSRTANKEAFLCVIGYGKLIINNEIDPIICHFYKNVIGPYWNKERVYIDEAYKTIPFPYNEITTPTFEMNVQWSLQHLVGYLNTWSAVKHYINIVGSNPVDLLQNQLASICGNDEVLNITFPLFIRLAKP